MNKNAYNDFIGITIHHLLLLPFLLGLCHWPRYFLIGLGIRIIFDLMTICKNSHISYFSHIIYHIFSLVDSGSVFNVLRARHDPEVEDRQTQPWTLSSYGDNLFLLIFYAADDVENNVNDD